MPFEPASPQILGSIGFLPAETPEAPGPGILGTLGAAFRRENTVGSFLANEGAGEPFGEMPHVNPAFNALDGMTDDDKARYSGVLKDLALADTEEAASLIRQQYDRETADRETLDKAGGWGTVAAIGAAVLDPINLLPVGGAVAKGVQKGSRLVRAATTTARAGLLATAASETLLQGSQLSRTGLESAVNIAGGTLLAGALGGAFSLFSKHPAAQSIARQVEEEVAVARGLSRGAGGSVGAAAAPTTTLAEETLRGAAGLEKVLKFQDPLLRTIQSPSITTRRTAQELAELPLELQKNAEGVPTAPGGSVETRIKTWQAPLAASLVDLDRLFVRYRLGREKRLGDMTRLGLGDMLGRNGELMTFQEFKAAVAEAMRRGDQHAIPEVAEAARTFRRVLFDPLKDRAIEARLLPEGVEVKTADSYLSRVYNKQKIAARRGEFVRILAQWLREKNPEADALELERVADQITDRILGTPDGRIPYEPMGDITMGERGGSESLPGARGPAMGRTLDIRDELVESFLENDVEVIARAYTRTLSADAELAAKFGDPLMTRAMQDVLADYAGRATKLEAEGAGERGLRGLQKQKDADIRDLAAMRDRLRGAFALPRDPTSWGSTAGRVVRLWNYLRLMGSVLLSSIPDLGRPLWVHGFRAFRQGLAPLVSSFGKYRAAAEEVKLAGAGLDLVLDSRAMAISDVLDDYAHGSRFERALRLGNERFGVASLMAPWNAALQQFTGVVTMSRILETAHAWSGGKISPKDLRALAAGGIGEDMARRIADQFGEFGTRERGLWLPDTSRWTDREAAAALRSAVVRDVDRIIIKPGQDKPLWMSTELGKVVGQFRSFAIASTQRVFLSGLQQRDAAALSGLVMMTGLGMLRYGLYLWAAEKAIPEDWQTWVIEGFDRAGIVGWLMEAHNGVEKLTGGAIGINALREGAQPMSRFASRNQVDALLGPTFGGAKDAWDVLASTFSGNWSAHDVKAARRLLPLQNLFYVRGLFDKLQRGLAGVVGVDLPE